LAKAEAKMDFDRMSLEYLAQWQLENVFAMGAENGVRTNDLSGALMKSGHPEKDKKRLARELNELRVKLSTGNRMKRDGVGYEHFVGTKWVGGNGGEPWNQFIWFLPFWRSVNELRHPSSREATPEEIAKGATSRIEI
jgi:hypothetical protein